MASAWQLNWTISLLRYQFPSNPSTETSGSSGGGTVKTLLELGCLWQTDYSHVFLLTLNIEGDAVGKDLLVVRGDARQRLLVCLSAGHQNIVTLDRERPVRVPVLSCGRFPRHTRLPPVCVEDRVDGRWYTLLRAAEGRGKNTHLMAAGGFPLADTQVATGIFRLDERATNVGVDRLI